MNAELKVRWQSRLPDPLGRNQFLCLGLALFLIKFFVDMILAAWVFQRPWPIYNYLSGAQASLWITATGNDRVFYLWMLLASMPFVIAGIFLTTRRLRAMGWPLLWVVLFFFPLINFLFFWILCLVPSARDERSLTSLADECPSKIGRLMPSAPWPSAGVAIPLTAFFGIALASFDVYILGVYGAGLFVGLPFSLGLLAAVLHGYSSVRPRRECIWTALASVTLVALGMLMGRLEGIVCLLMAAPIWGVCAALGGWVGYAIQRDSRDRRDIVIVQVGLMLALPVFMGAEYVYLPEAPQFVVRTTMTIDAPPERVWKHVVSFPPLADPTHWLFRTGIAYPTEATIEGEGVGAIRRCEFSTGTFVEPILEWREPSRLAFSVEHSPEPMTEWALFGEAHPPHLQGFMVSRAGEFQLERLEGSRTRLRGSTWYQHNMWPAQYWRLWSDFIVHTIHRRVLGHIRSVSETGEATSWVSN